MIIFNQKFIKLILLFFSSVILLISIIFLYKFYFNKNFNHDINFNPGSVNNVENFEIIPIGIVNNWSLTIPSINLININIAEGTTSAVFQENIGHFRNTSMYNGNVGLAAHNRGYKNNYFSNLDKLIIGDEIIYKCIYGLRKYRVDIIENIDSYDWSYLENTKENRLTLITCINDKPNLRLCVSAKKVKGENE